jgi:hypothetical protein
MSTAAQYRFSWDPRYQRAARLFGITPSRAWVDLDADRLLAHFGAWCVRTPRANVLDAEITGPYAFLKTAGPPRLGITDRSLSFATNGEAGVCLTFARPVAGIEPTGLLTHPSLTLTVDDLDGFAAALHRDV